MRRWSPVIGRGALAAAVVVLWAPGPSAQELRATDLLDRYHRGDFASVVAELEKQVKFDDLLNQFERDGPGWIDAGGPATRARRRLAAVTLALEAARIGQWTAWKHYITAPAPGFPLQVVWDAPPRLIEWSCELLRKDGRTPDATERLWHLAALGVAQRSEDVEFLFSEGVKVANRDDEIDHLLHAARRFPAEPRFRLAEGTSTEWSLPDHAIKVFERLRRDPDVGGEAAMRLGATYLRQRQEDRAIALFEEVETQSRDPWVLYLARYLRGSALERGRRPADAERIYRAALAALPAVQSASVALAALLAETDRQSEASELIAAMFRARPTAVDPWRGYVHADDRFWPTLIAALRSEIHR